MPNRNVSSYVCDFSFVYCFIITMKIEKGNIGINVWVWMRIFRMTHVLQWIIFIARHLDILNDLLLNFEPFVQFKKREKHSWRSVIFSKIVKACNVTKSKTPPWVFFSRFLNCTTIFACKELITWKTIFFV